jgi:PAS domain S-box-containing protein
LARIGEVVDCIPEPFFVLDESLAIRALNREGALLFGASKEDLLGIPMRDFCPDFPRMETSNHIAGTSGPAETQVRRFRTKTRPSRESGPSVPVDLSLTRISIAHNPYLLALMKRSLEPIPEL